MINLTLIHKMLNRHPSLNKYRWTMEYCEEKGFLLNCNYFGDDVRITFTSDSYNSYPRLLPQFNDLYMKMEDLTKVLNKDTE